jgi:hypothetical protein
MLLSTPGAAQFGAPRAEQIRVAAIRLGGGSFGPLDELAARG